MKFGLSFVNAGPFANPAAMTHLAQSAERHGIESLWAVEHVVIPKGYQSAYPYDPSGKIPAPESVPIPDPFLALAYLAAVTTRIRLATGILILPQRHPLYVAKEAATLDVLSGGRAILGIGVGWLAEEFAALGLSFDDRAARTAECVRALRSLWKADPEAFEGRFFRWAPLHSHPKPVQAGGVPIVVGGHTPLSAKRAARYGDGYFPGRGTVETLGPLLAAMRTECARIGRAAGDIEVTAAGYTVTLDAVRQLADLGVSRLVLMPPGFDPRGVDDGLARLADEVIAKL